MLGGGLRARETTEECLGSRSRHWFETNKKIESTFKFVSVLLAILKRIGQLVCYTFDLSCDPHLPSHGPSRTKPPQPSSRPTQARSESSPVALWRLDLSENERREDWVARRGQTSFTLVPGVFPVTPRIFGESSRDSSNRLHPGSSC